VSGAGAADEAADASVPIGVAVVDDQRLFASGMRMLVDAQPDMLCVGVALDGDAAVALVDETEPDVLLLDLRMPGTNGFETMERVFRDRALDAPPRVVVLTTLRRDDAVLAALRAGAAAFLTKDATPDVVLGTIRAVHAGAPAPTAEEAVALLAELGTPAFETQRDETLDVLSAREREVFLLVARGLTNQEITEALFISDATVKSHVRAVFAKLGLRGRVQAVVLAYERGLVRGTGVSVDSIR
jgi:DNA-binding NarL/FixJ family response regulator